MHIVYIAPRGFEGDLRRELGLLGITILEERERLFLCSVPAGGIFSSPVWAQNTWLDPSFLPVSSISQAARALKSLQRNWVLHPTSFFRRAKLIQEQLPKVSAKALHFGDALPQAPLGAWTLWDEKLMLASPCTTSPFADGELSFVENKSDPPGRAYLKLWEALTLIEQKPKPGELCLDLGSSPGSWTWVLAGCGAKVISVDKSALASNVGAMPGVEFVKGSAFALDPHEFGTVDWLFCDVICYPQRLFTMLKNWIAAGTCRNFICTIKFQGDTDFEAIELFKSVDGSRIIHLFHNKHELTWVLLNNENSR